MSQNTKQPDVGITYATNLYDDAQRFQLGKTYVVKRIHNAELNTQIYALMDGDTFCGSLTSSAISKAAHLFQPGFRVKVKISKVNATQAARYSATLQRLQSWTTGRGDIWHEAEEGEKGEKAGNGDDKGDKGLVAKAESKSAPADDSSSGQSSTE